VIAEQVLSFFTLNNKKSGLPTIVSNPENFRNSKIQTLKEGERGRHRTITLGIL